MHLTKYLSRKVTEMISNGHIAFTAAVLPFSSNLPIQLTLGDMGLRAGGGVDSISQSRAKQFLEQSLNFRAAACSQQPKWRNMFFVFIKRKMEFIPSNER